MKGETVGVRERVKCTRETFRIDHTTTYSPTLDYEMTSIYHATANIHRPYRLHECACIVKVKQQQQKANNVQTFWFFLVFTVSSYATLKKSDH